MSENKYFKISKVFYCQKFVSGLCRCSCHSGMTTRASASQSSHYHRKHRETHAERHTASYRRSLVHSAASWGLHSALGQNSPLPVTPLRKSTAEYIERIIYECRALTSYDPRNVHFWMFKVYFSVIKYMKKHF